MFLMLIVMIGCKSNKISNSDRKIEENINKLVEVSKSVKIFINDNEYIINLEDNDTVNDFINILPIKLNMNELNGNEKYVYLDTTLNSNPVMVKHINKGDVMLYGNNCLVIFYKSFDTSYSYTRIGYIDNLPDFGDENISVMIEK